MLLFFAAAVLTGALTPIQTAANARLRKNVGDVAAVTLVSFTVSLLVLLAAAAAGGGLVLPTADMLRSAPWWSWCGGLIALFTIAASIQLFKALGQFQAALLPMLGQLLFSLVIDSFGLFGARVIPLSAARALAACLLIAGALSAAARPNVKAGAPRGGAGGTAGLWQTVGVGAGCLMATIGAIYGSLGTMLGSAVSASAISFAAAVAAAALSCAVTGRIKSIRGAFRGGPWWMWLGGICGALAVCGNAWLIPRIGAGAFFMALLLGQISLSLCMERRGLLGAPQKNITAAQLAGTAMMFAGAVIVRL